MLSDLFYSKIYSLSQKRTPANLLTNRNRGKQNSTTKRHRLLVNRVKRRTHITGEHAPVRAIQEMKTAVMWGMLRVHTKLYMQRARDTTVVNVSQRIEIVTFTVICGFANIRVTNSPTNFMTTVTNLISRCVKCFFTR